MALRARNTEKSKTRGGAWKRNERELGARGGGYAYQQIQIRFPDKRVPKKLSGGEKLDRDHETKMDLQERRIVMVISWHAVPHCPAEEQRWKTTQERRGRGGGNARGKTEASRHPIFSSHFTKSRSYFTIPLVAGTILVCAPFSIRHCTPKVSLSAALVFTKFVTWLGATTVFFLSLLFSNCFLLSPLRFFSTIFDSTRYWDAVICPQFDHKWRTNHGNIYWSAVKAVFLLFLFFSSPLHSSFFSFSLFCFFSRCSFFLFSFLFFFKRRDISP